MQLRTDILNIIPVKAATYPHAWFKDKPKKPEVRIAANFADYKDRSRDAMQNALLGTANPDAATTAAFLYSHALNIDKKATAECWISYGVELCDGKTKIGPMDLLALKEGPELTKAIAANDSTDWREPFYQIGMAYRIKKARESPDQNYVSGLVTKLSNLGKSCSW